MLEISVNRMTLCKKSFCGLFPNSSFVVRQESHNQDFAQFSCINRVKGRASLWLTIAGTRRQFYCEEIEPSSILPASFLKAAVLNEKKKMF